jgi:hypothetical protein
MHFFLTCHHISLGWRWEKGCEAVVHGIWATLDAHLNWVVLEVDIVNDFNTIKRKAIF